MHSNAASLLLSDLQTWGNLSAFVHAIPFLQHRHAELVYKALHTSLTGGKVCLLAICLLAARNHLIAACFNFPRISELNRCAASCDVCFMLQCPDLACSLACEGSGSTMPLLMPCMP